MDDKVEIIHDGEGHKIVVINDIRFGGRRHISWEEVEEYLKHYIDCCYEINETAEKICIGSDFPKELKGSGDTKALKGTNAKAKANATQVIPTLLRCATNKRWSENYKEKHNKDAKYGWYRYTSRFALPIYDNNGRVIHLNIFRIELLIRHASDGKLYLYDLVNIKKETKYPT